MTAAYLIAICIKKNLTIATAESCTGGMISAALTDIAGSSALFGYGFVTYANAAKMDMLGVSETLLIQHGAVSSEVAGAMAQGAKARAKSDIAIAVTGIAGPGGGSADKPVGTVWFGLAKRDGMITTHHRIFTGDRGAIRAQTRDLALAFLLEDAEQ